MTEILRSIEDFFARNRIGILLAAILAGIAAIVISPLVVVPVNSGEGGVLFKRFSGTQMDRVYAEGLYLLWPWDTMFVYSLRVQTETREIEVLTKGGLPIKLTLVVRYHPDYRTLTKLHRSVGPQYVERVVLPETISVLRKFIGKYDPREIYQTERGFLDRIVLNALEQSERRFVSIDDVLIKSVKLPEAIRRAIEEKLTFQQTNLSYKFRLQIELQEAERKRIEARGIRDYNETVQETLADNLIRWEGVQATKELATSTNAKTVIIGGGKDGLPVILGNADSGPVAPLPVKNGPYDTPDKAANPKPALADERKK
jgi:regulator of protease activity HflC (stomatin/prohibitin superfamily)